MYPNFKSELTRLGLTVTELAEKANYSLSSVNKKLSGKIKLSFDDAKLLKKALGTDLPLEVLFSEEAI